MIGSRIQEFDYQHKTIALASAYFQYLEAHTLVMLLPKDLIQIKNLYIYLEIDFKDLVFDLATPPQYVQPQANPTPPYLRKIQWVGGDGGRKQVEVIGGSDNIVRYKHDFSNELNLFGISDGKPQQIDGQKSLKIQFSCGNQGQNSNLRGKVRLWKVDIIYTTKGIR